MRSGMSGLMVAVHPRAWPLSANKTQQASNEPLFQAKRMDNCHSELFSVGSSSWPKIPPFAEKGRFWTISFGQVQHFLWVSSIFSAFMTFPAPIWVSEEMFCVGAPSKIQRSLSSWTWQSLHCMQLKFCTSILGRLTGLAGMTSPERIWKQNAKTLAAEDPRPAAIRKCARTRRDSETHWATIYIKSLIKMVLSNSVRETSGSISIDIKLDESHSC